MLLIGTSSSERVGKTEETKDTAGSYSTSDGNTYLAE